LPSLAKKVMYGPARGENSRAVVGLAVKSLSRVMVLKNCHLTAYEEVCYYKVQFTLSRCKSHFFTMKIIG